MPRKKTKHCICKILTTTVVRKIQCSVSISLSKKENQTKNIGQRGT